MWVNVELIQPIFSRRVLDSDGKIEEYSKETRTWEPVADIPDFKTTNGLATKSNRLWVKTICDDPSIQMLRS